jgi:Tfp pilus assembly protein PilE
VTDRLIRITSALAVIAVAAVAAVISYQHAVRHEAPHNREEVQGLFCRVVAAAR